MATLAVGAASAGAQSQFALKFDSTAVAVTRDVEYGRADTLTLRLDVYRPKSAGAAKLPALVFLNRGVGSASRGWVFYMNWARSAAARGLVTVIPDIRAGSEAADYSAIIDYLIRNATQHGIDSDRIAIYAASSNAGQGLPWVQGPNAAGVAAAIIYYGAAPVERFRIDLPLLYVRAGLDRPDLNRAIIELAGRAVAQNAPVTLLNNPGGYHGFETLNDDDASREVMERTIAFVKESTAPGFRAALRAGAREATAAAHVSTGRFGDAAAIYRELVDARPEAHTLRLAYGEALLGDRQYQTACDEFEKLKGKGLGPRDLGVPAARACAGKGDAAAAIAWISSIPPRFRPTTLKDDPAFSALRERADFRALFEVR